MPARHRSPLAGRLAERIDPGHETPVMRQIVDHVWEEVVSGTLETGARLPTVRQLAIDLGLNPKVVTRAYEELERLGVVSVNPGEGTFVSLNEPNGALRERRIQLDQVGREAVAGAEALGFTLDDLIDTLDDLRTATD